MTRISIFGSIFFDRLASVSERFLQDRRGPGLARLAWLDDAKQSFYLGNFCFSRNSILWRAMFFLRASLYAFLKRFVLQTFA
jgi:hypothetical protein